MKQSQAERRPSGWTLGAYIGLAAFACPKQRHDDQAAAEQHLARLRADGSEWSHRGELHIYTCDRCGALHVGHTEPRTGVEQ